MYFTTRNPREAEAFVDQLPFSEKFKSIIKDSFAVTTRIHDLIMSTKQMNSKGAERYFLGKMQSGVENHTNQLVDQIMPNTDSLDINEDEIRMACMFEAQLLALKDLGEEVGLTELELSELINYCDICEVALKTELLIVENDDDE